MIVIGLLMIKFIHSIKNTFDAKKEREKIAVCYP